MTTQAANCELGGHLVEEADIQRLLCVESHIKVNLAPSALVLQSTNLLSVWWGSWTGSPFQHTATNPQDLFSFFSPSFPDNYSHRSDLERLTWSIRLKHKNSFLHILYFCYFSLLSEQWPDFLFFYDQRGRLTLMFFAHLCACTCLLRNYVLNNRADFIDFCRRNRYVDLQLLNFQSKPDLRWWLQPSKHKKHKSLWKSLIFTHLIF